jgi:hypothetical protein
MQRHKNGGNDRHRRELPPSELGGGFRRRRAFVPARRRLSLCSQRSWTETPYTAGLRELRLDREHHQALASAPENHEAAAVAA